MNLNVFSLIYILAIFCMIFLTFLFFTRFKVEEMNLSYKEAMQRLVIMSVIAIGLRMLLFAAIKGFDSDMGCWIGWGGYIARYGFSEFYTDLGHEWYDYPPAYMYVLGLISKISLDTGIANTAFWFEFVYLIPPIVTDILCAFIVFLTSNEFLQTKDGNKGASLILASFILFNPAIFFLSGAWGQIDVILSTLLVLVFLCIVKEKFYLMGILYGLAIATKWQALIFGPVILSVIVVLYTYKKISRKRSFILNSINGGIVALLTVFVLSLPFKGDQKLLWLVDKYRMSTGGYDYATIEAYNFFASLGANWREASKPFLGPVTYKTFGTIMITLLIITIIVCAVRDRLVLKDNVSLAKKRVFLHGAFFMYGVYTFGHYMHERYIFPVIILLVFAYIMEDNKDVLLSNVILSTAVFLNEMVALYVTKPDTTGDIRFGSMHKTTAIFCGILEVLSFGYFCFVYFNRNKKRGES